MNKQAQAGKVHQHGQLPALRLCTTLPDPPQTGHWGSGCLFNLTPSEDAPPPSLLRLFHAAFASDLQLLQNEVKASQKVQITNKNW